jgi:hypothetical protein
MSKHAVLALLVALSVGSAVGCSAETSPGIDDQEPAPETSESELVKTKFTRLDTATANDVADAFESRFNSELDTVLAAHPTILTVTKTNVSTLTAVGTTFYMDLGDSIRGILDHLGQASAKPTTLRSKARGWALAKLASHVQADGTVKFQGIDPIALYEATKAAEEKNALARAAKPRGVVFATVRSQWQAVQSDRDNLDSSFLNPVKVSKEPTLTEIKKHFGLSSRLSLQSWGYEAVDAMASAGEGPDNRPSFRPLAQTSKYAIGIKKRFFFSGGGDGWSSHVLILMDEHFQLWGFSMGYSE